MDTQKEKMESVRNLMESTYRAAYETMPGLEQFSRIKKGLLWGMMCIFVVQKLLVIFAMSSVSIVIILLGGLMGLFIPGVIAITAYRGPWKVSMIFYLMAALVSFDLLKAGQTRCVRKR